MIRRLFIAALCCFAFAANAALTAAQKATLKVYILAQGDLNQLYIDGNLGGLAAALNTASSPAFIVWKTAVPTMQVGQAMSSTELAGLTTADTNRLQVFAMYAGGTFNPSKADTRAGFDAVFSGAGGVNTRAALLVLWKRTATRAEAVLATGTGSDATPGLLTFEGLVLFQELQGL